MIHLRLTDALDHDPFDARDIGLRVLAGALCRPTRRKRATAARMQRHVRACGRLVAHAGLALFAGSASGMALAGLLVSVARVGAAVVLGG